MSKLSNRLRFLRELLDMDEEQTRQAIDNLESVAHTVTAGDYPKFHAVVRAAIAIRELKFG